MSGVKDDDPEPCPRTWDPWRKTWSDSWKEHLYDYEIKMLKEEHKDQQVRARDYLAEPKNLMEIVQLGIDKPNLCISCLAEVLEQLYNTDQYQVLISLDGYSEWFRPTQYPSFRYENDKNLRGTVPPYDISIIRLLMKFDGHKIRNGVKLAATTQYRQFNHICTPYMLNFFPGYDAEVSNLTLNDFRNALTYYNFTDWMPELYYEWQIETLYMETQGNWWAWHQRYLRYQGIHYNHI